MFHHFFLTIHSELRRKKEGREIASTLTVDQGTSRIFFRKIFFYRIFLTKYRLSKNKKNPFRVLVEVHLLDFSIKLFTQIS